MLFVAAIFCLLIGLSALYVAWLSRKSQRRLRYYCCMCISGLTTSSGVAFVLIGVLLISFHRLSHEEFVGELVIEQTAPQQFTLRLLRPNRDPQVFTLNGDEWQLDARILKWHSWVNVFGLHTLYRLERLSSRYRSIEQTNQTQFPVYSLLDQSLSSSLYQLYQWLPLVDAYYGNSAYMPLGHGARYQISISTSGVIARPSNMSAETLLQQW